MSTYAVPPSSIQQQQQQQQQQRQSSPPSTQSLEFKPSTTLQEHLVRHAELRGSYSQLSPSRRSSSSSSPTHRPITPGKETILSSKLLADLSPQKVWDAAPTSASRTSLPELFKLRNSLKALRPSYPSVEEADGDAQELGQAQPQLLQRLEAFLDAQLSAVESSSNRGLAMTRLRTDAHRQVFDAFLHSFMTYRSLLSRVKVAYDRGLDDAMRAVSASVLMQAELAAAQEQTDAAQRSAQRTALEDAALARNEVLEEIEEQELLAADAEARWARADREAQEITARTAALATELEELTQANKEARAGMLAESSFGVLLPPEEEGKQEGGKGRQEGGKGQQGKKV